MKTTHPPALPSTLAATDARLARIHDLARAVAESERRRAQAETWGALLRLLRALRPQAAHAATDERACAAAA
jgi:hypothetical protein